MGIRCRLTFCLAGCAFLAGPLCAAHPESPRSTIPQQAADLLVEVPEPARLVDSVVHAEVYRRLLGFSAVREALTGTKARRLRQLVAHLEKELGLPWPALLDRLAGGGVALAVKFAPNPAPVLLVIQGKDEKLLEKFVNVTLDVTAQELARKESKDRIERETYLGSPLVRIGPNFFAATAGRALVISNKKEALKLALEVHQGKGGPRLADASGPAEAARLLPAEPLARLWINLGPLQNAGQAKNLFTMPREVPQLTVLAGAYLDLIGRSPWAAAGLYQEKQGLHLAVRLPRGRDGMGPDRALFVPPAGQAGSRPLLEPRHVLYSDSGYEDLARVWEDRHKLFKPVHVKALEDFDKNSGKFLSGLQLSKLLGQAGAYQRVVVVNQPAVPYSVKPKQPVPAFALVLELRDADGFSRSMATVLRGAALLALTRVKLKMVEERYAGSNLVGWRFDESAPLKTDVNDVRFNFSPCFATVGNQFVASSTLELGRELIDLLRKEGSSPGAAQTARRHVHGAGVAEALQGAEDGLWTQTILDQALPPDEARAQVRAFLDLVRQLGTLSLEATMAEKEFHYDIRLGAAKGR